VAVWAVLVAAGRGERLGLDQPKAFAKLGEDPLLAESLRRLDDSGWVDAIVVVAPPGWEEPAILLAEELGCGKVSACVGGGAERADSVRNGLAEVPPDAVAVLVHDAARPLVEVELVEAVTRRAFATGAALPVLPLVDTVKRVRGGRVVETLDRSELGGAQTPQGFRMALLREALEAATRAGLELTDEAMAVERLGHAVDAVPGSKRNRKLTTPDDLAWAEGVVAGILHT